MVTESQHDREYIDTENGASVVSPTHLTRVKAASERGNYYFRLDFGRDAITNFRLGIASRYSAAVGNGHRGFRWFEQQWFAGDVWKARPSLALNVGLRYTPVTGPT